ncbi:MAG: hypothetical protein ACYS18_00210 [Planctomycetota bacterium]|jgi:hypothetical protein
MKKANRQLVLNKGKERFIFRYERGCEDQLLDTLIEQAKDRRTDFDWFDAAVLSFKLTQSLIGQADELLRGKGSILQTGLQKQGGKDNYR